LSGERINTKKNINNHRHIKLSRLEKGKRNKQTNKSQLHPKEILVFWCPLGVGVGVEVLWILSFKNYAEAAKATEKIVHWR